MAQRPPFQPAPAAAPPPKIKDDADHRALRIESAEAFKAFAESVKRSSDQELERALQSR